MVSIPLVALMVSTLAVHGKEVSTDVPVIPKGCEGKTLCDVKPDNYPQEKIDDFFVENPEYLKRLKREIGITNSLNKELEEGNIDGNCKRSVKVDQPYFVIDANRLPQMVVHSSFFNQTVQTVTCEEPPNSNDAQPFQCFRALAKGSFKGSECRQVTRKHKFVVYDHINIKPVEVFAFINVDCICAKL